MDNSRVRSNTTLPWTAVGPLQCLLSAAEVSSLGRRLVVIHSSCPVFVLPCSHLWRFQVGSDGGFGELAAAGLPGQVSWNGYELLRKEGVLSSPEPEQMLVGSITSCCSPVPACRFARLAGTSASLYPARGDQPRAARGSDTFRLPVIALGSVSTN